MRPATVNHRLTPNRRTRYVVENDAFAAFVRRVVAAQGRRIAAGDIEGLAELLALADHVETSIRTAVQTLHDQHGYSWAEIADRSGTSRQAAHKRWRLDVATDLLIEVTD